MNSEDGARDDDFTSGMAQAEQVQAVHAAQDQDLRVAIERAAAKSHHTPTPDQEKALNELASGIGEPLSLARTLRSAAHLLEAWHLPDSDLVRQVSRLVQLTNADAIALVEDGKVPIDQAAMVGHRLQEFFMYHHPVSVCEEFQIRAMTRLAENRPESESDASPFIDEAANQLLDEQKTERRLLECTRIEAEPFWSKWHALSWIAFEDAKLLCEIEDADSLRRLRFYGEQTYGKALKQAKPEPALLKALRDDDLKAIRNGVEIEAIYWADKQAVDHDVIFRKKSIRRCWHGPDGWNGFHDPFWSLGQVIIWIITRDPDDVDQASDDSGRIGTSVGYAGILASVRLEELLRDQRANVEAVANDLRRRCQRNEFEALFSEGVISIANWIDLKISFSSDGAPIVKSTKNGKVLDDVRFKREQILGSFQPKGGPRSGERDAVIESNVLTLLEASAADESLIGEVLKNLAFDHPTVQAARSDLATYNRTKQQIAAFNGIFEGGFFLWPISLTVGALDEFFRPATLHDEEVTWAPLPEAVAMAFEQIVGSFHSIMQALRNNQVALVDMDNNAIHKSVWSRPGLSIDLARSDIYDDISAKQLQSGQVPLFRSVTLRPELNAHQERQQAGQDDVAAGAEPLALLTDEPNVIAPIEKQPPRTRVPSPAAKSLAAQADRYADVMRKLKGNRGPKGDMGRGLFVAMFTRDVEELRAASRKDLEKDYPNFGWTKIEDSRQLVLSLNAMSFELNTGKLTHDELRDMSNFAIAEYAEGRPTQAAKARDILLADQSRHS